MREVLFEKKKKYLLKKKKKICESEIKVKL